MIVIIAGMYRSGSTFTYNVARELLLTTDDVDCYAADTFDELSLSALSDNHVLIKTHQPSKLISQLIMRDGVKCVSSTRKPEDAIASWVNVFNDDLEHTINIIEAWLNWFSSISNKVLNIEYETIDHHPLLATFLIQWHLLRSLNPFTAYKIARKYNKKKVKQAADALEESVDTQNAGFSYYDKTTFFHRKHVSSIQSTPAAEILSKQQLDLIHEKLANYIDETGNLSQEKIAYQSNVALAQESFTVSFNAIIEEKDEYLNHLKQEVENKNKENIALKEALKKRDKFTQHLEQTLQERDQFIAHLKKEKKPVTNTAQNNKLTKALKERDQFILHLEHELKDKSKAQENFDKALQERDHFTKHLEQELKVKNKAQADFVKVLQERDQYIEHLKKEIKATG